MRRYLSREEGFSLGKLADRRKRHGKGGGDTLSAAQLIPSNALGSPPGVALSSFDA